MLEGENVQQMMDRINAVTPAYREGYLTNGKPITEENIKEMLDAVIADMPEGTIWDGDSLFLYNNAKVWGTVGSGCNSYEYSVSDYLFGEDAPIVKHTDYDSIKPGDVVYYNQLGNGHGHVEVATATVFAGTGQHGYRDISANTHSYNGNDRGTIEKGLKIMEELYGSNGEKVSVVYSRY